MLKFLLSIGTLCFALETYAADTLSTPLYDVALGSLEKAVLTRDCKHLLTLSGKVYIWDVETERIVKTLIPLFPKPSAASP
jgi:hypothetical protein